jgi:hypothetical protein
MMSDNAINNYTLTIQTQSLEELERYTKSLDMALALYDIQEILRKYVKYGFDEPSSAGSAQDIIKNRFHECLEARGIDLGRLLK